MKYSGLKYVTRLRATTVYPLSAAISTILKIWGCLYPRDHDLGRTRFSISNIHQLKERTFSAISRCLIIHDVANKSISYTVAFCAERYEK